MPKDIGAYKQGTPIPHAEDQPHEVGAPKRKEDVFAPTKVSEKREAHKVVGNNDAHIAK